MADGYAQPGTLRDRITIDKPTLCGVVTALLLGALALGFGSAAFSMAKKLEDQIDQPPPSPPPPGVSPGVCYLDPAAAASISSGINSYGILGTSLTDRASLPKKEDFPSKSPWINTDRSFVLLGTEVPPVTGTPRMLVSHDVAITQGVGTAHDTFTRETVEWFSLTTGVNGETDENAFGILTVAPYYETGVFAYPSDDVSTDNYEWLWGTPGTPRMFRVLEGSADGIYKCVKKVTIKYTVSADVYSYKLTFSDTHS
jgi:hypothetical protein